MEFLLAIILSAGPAFLYFGLVFRPLEAVFPARAEQRFFRPEWFTDFCFFLGQNLLWTDLVLRLLSHVSSWMDSIVPHGFRQSVAAQPWWLQAIEVMLASDCCIYWG